MIKIEQNPLFSFFIYILSSVQRLPLKSNLSNSKISKFHSDGWKNISFTAKENFKRRHKERCWLKSSLHWINRILEDSIDEKIFPHVSLSFHAWRLLYSSSLQILTLNAWEILSHLHWVRNMYQNLLQMHTPCDCKDVLDWNSWYLK